MEEPIQEAALCRVERRAIEASAVIPVIRAISRKIGKGQALAILREINQQEAFERGRRLAEETGQNGIETLVRDVAGWGDGGLMDMEVIEHTPATYCFNVTRCPYHDRYRELGVEEYGVALSCCRDEPFARGLNSRLKLVRTSTLMDGSDHCDFRYSLSAEEVK